MAVVSPVVSRVKQPVTRKPTDPGVGGWTPAQLFLASEQGAWYDPSDMSTMFQDSAGTIPVTAVEQPVGKILDKSGRGNHASQSTATHLRPVLSARKNLLTKTEQFEDESVWLLQVAGLTCTADVIAGPLPGTFGDYLKASTNEGNQRIQTDIIATLASPVVFSCYMKAGPSNAVASLTTWDGVIGRELVMNFGTGVATAVGPGATAVATPVGGGWYRVELRATLAASNALYGINTAGPANGTDDVYLYGAQLEYGTTATRYQRVNTGTDYDTVGFPHYLKFDGVDDFLRTTFPYLGSNATIARSVPGVGASILTGQTIGAGAWDDSTNHFGLVIVNRALTGPETAGLTAYLNELAGV